MTVRELLAQAKRHPQILDYTILETNACFPKFEIRDAGRWVKLGKVARAKRGYSKCPRCGYWAYDGFECFDCGYPRR